LAGDFGVRGVFNMVLFISVLALFSLTATSVGVRFLWTSRWTGGSDSGQKGGWSGCRVDFIGWY
jgi:hypothetical protein